MKIDKISNYQFTQEEKKKISLEITAFFLDEMEQEIGVIACDKVFDFFMENMGNLIYNKALDDSFLWYRKSMENVESDFYSLYKN